MAEKHILVLLSGCGVFDGSEIHEAVIALLALSKLGAKVTMTAPDKDQAHVINHQAGAPSEEIRNVLVESARIARGPVVPLREIDPADFDGIFLPGGFGAAKNLATFAFDGANCSIDEQVQRVIQGFHAQSKPIGACCIAPAVVVRALGLGIVTIGQDPDTAAAIQAMGGEHLACAVTEIAIDPANKLISAPAYMCDASLADVATGIERAVAATCALAD